MKPKKLPLLARLRELFYYIPHTGKLISLVDSKRRHAGDTVGTTDGKGHLQVYIDGRLWQVHRICWKLYYGVDPLDQIDHINGKRSDNKIVNLREASQLENNRNICIPKNNTSKIIGVTFHKATKKWSAQIRVNRKNIWLGVFTDKKSAITARKEAEKKYGFHPNHGRIGGDCRTAANVKIIRRKYNGT